MDEQRHSEVESLAEEENGKLSEEYKQESERETLSHHERQPRIGSFPNFVGKHRMQAAISHLDNQINILQEELEQLETIGESSTVCKEVISSVESIPDPLLPLTKGSVDEAWDRWFRGPHNSRNHKRWI